MERKCKNCDEPIADDHDGNWTHITGEVACPVLNMDLPEPVYVATPGG